MRRYLASAIVAASTLAAIAFLLASGSGSRPGVLLVVAAVGAPVSVFLGSIATAGERGAARSWAWSLVLGATMVPALVVLVSLLLSAVLMTMVAPAAQAARSVLGEAGNGGILDVLLADLALLLLVQGVLVAPLAEETLKPLGAMIRRPRTRYEALVFGGAAGAGFAAIENLLYASDGFDLFGHGWLAVSVFRIAGAGLHIFGASLISLALFERRSRVDRPLVRLVPAYLTALATHAVWNGAIIVFSVWSVVGPVGEDPVAGSFQWGAALLVTLGGFGVLLNAGVLLVARGVRTGRPLSFATSLATLTRPSGVAAWAIGSTAMLVPVVVAVTIFPDFVGLR